MFYNLVAHWLLSNNKLASGGNKQYFGASCIEKADLG